MQYDFFIFIFFLQIKHLQCCWWVISWIPQELLCLSHSHILIHRNIILTPHKNDNKKNMLLLQQLLCAQVNIGTLMLLPWDLCRRGTRPRSPHAIRKWRHELHVVDFHSPLYFFPRLRPIRFYLQSCKQTLIICIHSKEVIVGFVWNVYNVNVGYIRSSIMLAPG